MPLKPPGRRHLSETSSRDAPRTRPASHRPQAAGRQEAAAGAEAVGRPRRRRVGRRAGRVGRDRRVRAAHQPVVRRRHGRGGGGRGRVRFVRRRPPPGGREVVGVRLGRHGRRGVGPRPVPLRGAVRRRPGARRRGQGVGPHAGGAAPAPVLRVVLRPRLLVLLAGAQEPRPADRRVDRLAPALRRLGHGRSLRPVALPPRRVHARDGGRRGLLGVHFRAVPAALAGHPVALRPRADGHALTAPGSGCGGNLLPVPPPFVIT